MSASIVSRVSVNTASAATIIASADISAFVADSSNSSIGVADARFAARRFSSILARFTAFSASASARRIASRFERFTPDPEEGSCAIGTVSSELLSRSDSWFFTCVICTSVQKSFRCRNRPHSVRYRCKENSFSAFHRVPTLCDVAHPDRSCNQVFANHIPSSAQEHFSTLASSTQDHPTDSHATHHDDALRLDANQSPHLSQKSNRGTRLSEIVVVSRHHRVDRPRYDEK